MSALQLDSTFVVLSIMSCLSLALSLFLHLRNRALQRLSRNLQANVFDRTFSVFDPYPEHRKTVHSFPSLFPLLTLAGGLTSAYLAVNILAMGLVLGLATFIFCLGLMMADEAFEIYKNVNMFTKAVSSGADFGVGDLAVLLVMKKTLPRLRGYYFFLSIAFLASLAALPYIVPAFVLAFAQVVHIAFELSVHAGILEPFGLIFLLAAVEVALYVTVRKAKSRIFGSPSSQSLISAVSATARMRISYETMVQIFEAKPEEITY